MEYNAGYEAKFKALTNEARDAMENDEWEKVGEKLKEAKKLTDKLYPGFTSDEKVQFLILTRQSYETIAGLYIRLYDESSGSEESKTRKEVEKELEAKEKELDESEREVEKLEKRLAAQVRIEQLLECV